MIIILIILINKKVIQYVINRVYIQSRSICVNNSKFNSKVLTFSRARLRNKGSYEVEGIASENQGGLYQRRKLQVLLEYKWPGGKVSKCSQSSINPLSSDEIQIDPEFKKWKTSFY